VILTDPRYTGCQVGNRQRTDREPWGRASPEATRLRPERFPRLSCGRRWRSARRWTVVGQPCAGSRRPHVRRV